jgi:acyl-CoA thioester hydrolase
MGHMNVMWYTGKFDEASWHLLSHLGLTRTLLKQNDRGMAALQQNICYKRELRSGDIVTIRSGVMEMKEKTMRLCHHMTNDETGEIVASTEITGVYMDTTNRRSCLFPANIFERGRELAEIGDINESGQPVWCEAASYISQDAPTLEFIK